VAVEEPDVEKRKKKRRRSARAYVNVDRLTPEEIAQRLAVVAQYFPSDDDDSGPDRASVGKRRISQSERKRLAREGKAIVNPDGHVSYPIETVEDLHNAATLARTGHGDVEAARKLIARRARELCVPNPLESSEKAMFSTPDPYSGSDYADARTSAPLTAGHQAPSTGDHGAGQGRGSHIAAHHPDLKQSNTSFSDVLARLRTVAGDNAYGDKDITYTAGEVALRQFDAAGQAGHYHNMQPVNPSPMRPDWHTARNSATAPNGSHALGNPASRPPQAMKASEARDMLRRHMFPGSGAR
jgi:hypothetical protein